MENLATRSSIVAATFAIVLATAPALAADLYVSSTTGNDANAGTSAKPWKTIGKAAGAAHAGDTVHVADGTYAEIVTESASGTSAAHIVFQADSTWKAQIVGPPHVAGASTPVAIWTVNGDYVDIIGFDLTGGPRVGILVNGSFVRTISNHVHDMKADWGGSAGGGGIVDGDYSAHDDDMIGNVVHDIGPAVSNGVHGLYHSNLRGKILNNISYRNAGWGIHTWHNPKDVLIANNLTFENREGGIIVGAGDKPGTGIADGFMVMNNIVVNNYGHAGIIEYGAVGSGNRYVNNLVWGNSAGAFTVTPATKISGTITSDPLFIKYDAVGNSGDYHLQAKSRAIDTGASAMAPLVDFDGVSRPQGPAWDIGPYEWRAAVDAGDAGDGGAIGSDGGDGGIATDSAVDADTAVHDSSVVGDSGATERDSASIVDTGALDAPPADGAPGDDAADAGGDPSGNDAAGCSCTMPRSSETTGRLGVLSLVVALAWVGRRRAGHRDAAGAPLRAHERHRRDDHRGRAPRA